MTITTVSGHQSNQDARKARMTAKGGPVSIADLLAMPGIEDVELEMPSKRDLPRVFDFGADVADER